MGKILRGLFVSVLVLCIIACQNTQPAENRSGAGQSDVPDWFASPPSSGSRFYGLAAARSEDLAKTKSEAVDLARADIADQLSRSLSSTLTSYMRAAGIRPDRETDSWIDEVLGKTSALPVREARHIRTYPVLEKNGDFTVYVLLEYDRSMALNEITDILNVHEEERSELFSTALLLDRMKMDWENNPPRSGSAEN
ncbi:MAG: hypothetical protein JXA95_18260 [Spirochaetales bacterium]|nr:hypothetical protein [Spirochaetales bacterium]